jgi:adenosylmethionine-8-amino-7-oxononanoate aminotransferase
MHKNIWYPFTIQKGALEPIKVEKGDGIWLQLEDGRRIMDCISSWWVNLYGHAHPEIASAISDQAQQLEQVIFADFTHEPAEKVAEKLAEILPTQLNRVFFSDDGSTAVEVAMKIALQYWKNRGEDRKSFICFEGAYHGDTFGAMSAGARSIFTEVFKDLLFDVDFLPYPCTWLNDDEIPKKEQAVIKQLEKTLQEHPEKYAGVMIEPLVQGASGMRMCREQFIKELERVCEEYNTLLLFDEVMTGFGRTGAHFASEKANVEPDIICLAKGLTGGFLPLSVTVCSDAVFDVFNSADPMKAFWHGHSYTANPLGCAAALASFRLLDEHRPVFAEMEQWHLEHLAKLGDHPLVKKRRLTGTIAAFDIAAGPQNGYLNKVGEMIKKRSVEEGMLFRPLGNVMYLMPPYCTTESQLAEMYEVIDIILRELEEG